MSFELDISTFHPDRPGIRKVLGDLEAEIMECIWENAALQGITVHDVFVVMYERRRLAYTTVMSTMARLAKKKLLRVEKAEQAYVYYPMYSQQEFISRFVRHIVEDLLVSFSDVTFAHEPGPDNTHTAEQASELLHHITQKREKEN